MVECVGWESTTCQSQAEGGPKERVHTTSLVSGSENRSQEVDGLNQLRHTSAIDPNKERKGHG